MYIFNKFNIYLNKRPTFNALLKNISRIKTHIIYIKPQIFLFFSEALSYICIFILIFIFSQFLIFLFLVLFYFTFFLLLLLLSSMGHHPEMLNYLQKCRKIKQTLVPSTINIHHVRNRWIHVWNKFTNIKSLVSITAMGGRKQ